MFFFYPTGSLLPSVRFDRQKSGKRRRRFEFWFCSFARVVKTTEREPNNHLIPPPSEFDGAVCSFRQSNEPHLPGLTDALCACQRAAFFRSGLAANSDANPRKRGTFFFCLSKRRSKEPGIFSGSRAHCSAAPALAVIERRVFPGRFG